MISLVKVGAQTENRTERACQTRVWGADGVFQNKDSFKMLD